MMSTTSLDSEELIALVRDRPPLYDVKDPYYHDKDVQDNLWKDVGDLLQVSGEEAKRRWRNLRGSYSKSIAPEKSAATANGGGFPKKRPKGEWYLKDHMNFLMPFMKQSPAAATYRSRVKHEKDVSDEEEDVVPETLLDFSPQSDEESIHLTRAREDKRRREESVGDLENSFMKHVNNTSCRSYLEHHSSKQSHLDDPDICFFVGLLPEIKQLSDTQKRKFKMTVHSFLNLLLEEGPSSSARRHPSDSRVVQADFIKALKTSDQTMLDTLAALEANSKCSL